MTICYFGIFDPDYNRNKVIITGLKANDINVIECRSSKTGLKKYIDLAKKHKKLKSNYDILLVGFPGWTIVPLARILARKKFIVFDVFTSLYDSLVNDRKTVKAGSVRAGYAKFVDKLSCKLADLILLDTKEHIKFFTDFYNMKTDKFVRVWAGSTMRPLPGEWKRDNDFVITFYGSDIPLQGVDYIIKAAALVKDKDIKFRIIGTKIKKRFLNGQYQNITFVDNVSYNELNYEMSGSGAVLGIFGGTDKARRVIPNKVYDAIYAGQALITADTPAVRELLEDRKNALFCRGADPKDLANKIVELKNNPALRQNIEQNNVILADKLKPKLIVKNLVEKLNSCCVKTGAKLKI